ncbi:Valine--tRNA ligase, partial [Frankliniella fusca]
ITCTSKPCTWNKGSLKRDPLVAAGRQYDSFKIDVIRRNVFDPRPTQHRNGPSTRMINDFLRALQKTKEIPFAFQGLLKIQYDDFTYDNIDFTIFKYLRRELYEYLLQLKPKHHSGPYELQGTTAQFESPLYRFVRSITCTASVCHQIAHFRSESAKKNFLQHQMWNMKGGESKGMAYGKTNEPIARQKYVQDQMDPKHSRGINLHTKYPGLSCSHDGWITRDGKVIKVLEIKCPYSLQSVDPNYFDSFLQGKKLQTFYLTRNISGDIELKEDTIYYDQVQMISRVVAPSKKGLLTIPITFNTTAWANLSPKLEKFHWEYMAVEYFARRTTLELNPLCLP